MKPNPAQIWLAALALTLGISSCTKTSDNLSGDIETTFDLSGKQAISENLTDDAQNLLNEAAESTGLSGSREPLVCSGTTSCASISVSPGAFPKTITLDFGTGCTNPGSGVVRRGIVNIVLSDSFRLSGSTAVVTFQNYFVNNYKKEGTITWTNTSTSSTRSWSRQVANGKITAPDGRYWLHTSTKNVVQMAGVSTPRNLLDDAFSITGTGQVTNAAGNSRTSTILTPLHKQVICDHVDQGTVRHENTNHYAIVDYGNGTCDNVATISINGFPPRTIILP